MICHCTPSTALPVTLHHPLLHAHPITISPSINPAHTLKQRLSEIDPILIAKTMEKFLPVKYRRIFAADNYSTIVEVNKKLIRELLDNIL